MAANAVYFYYTCYELVAVINTNSRWQQDTVLECIQLDYGVLYLGYLLWTDFVFMRRGREFHTHSNNFCPNKFYNFCPNKFYNQQFPLQILTGSTKQNFYSTFLKGLLVKNDKCEQITAVGTF